VRHAAAFTLSLLVLATGGVAQNSEPVDLQPGLIKADSPLYGVDKAYDQAATSVGLRDPGDVVHERASEAAVAQQRNNSEARDQALEDMNKVAEAAAGNTTGLRKAEQVLEAVKEQTQDQANQGIQQALGNVQAAQKRNASIVGKGGQGAIPEAPEQPERGQSGAPGPFGG